MAQNINELESEVAEEVGIMESATILINGFAARLADAGVDPAKLAALRADLDAKGSALATAVAQNTPAA
jgi:hypothetical protein